MGPTPTFARRISRRFSKPMPHAGLSQLAGGMVEVERTKHLYQADEFFGLGIKGVAGSWRLAELIEVGRSQRLHDQSALVLIDFDVVAHLILLNAAGPRFKVGVRLGLIERESLGVHEKKERPMPQSQAQPSSLTDSIISFNVIASNFELGRHGVIPDFVLEGERHV